MKKILSIDLGSNSIGLAVRVPEPEKTFEEQLIFFNPLSFLVELAEENRENFHMPRREPKNVLPAVYINRENIAFGKRYIY